MTQMNYDPGLAMLANPYLTPAQLAAIAEQRRDLWPQILQHPTCYAELRVWIVSQMTPAVPPPPAPQPVVAQMPVPAPQPVVGQTPALPPLSPPAVTPAPARPFGAPPLAVPQPKPKGGKGKGVLIGLLIGLFLAGGAFGAWWYFFKDAGTNWAKIDLHCNSSSCWGMKTKETVVLVALEDEGKVGQEGGLTETVIEVPKGTFLTKHSAKYFAIPDGELTKLYSPATIRDYPGGPPDMVMRLPEKTSNVEVKPGYVAAVTDDNKVFVSTDLPPEGDWSGWVVEDFQEAPFDGKVLDILPEVLPEEPALCAVVRDEGDRIECWDPETGNSDSVPLPEKYEDQDGDRIELEDGTEFELERDEGDLWLEEVDPDEGAPELPDDRDTTDGDGGDEDASTDEDGADGEGDTEDGEGLKDDDVKDYNDDFILFEDGDVWTNEPESRRVPLPGGATDLLGNSWVLLEEWGPALVDIETLDVTTLPQPGPEEEKPPTCEGVWKTHSIVTEAGTIDTATGEQLIGDLIPGGFRNLATITMNADGSAAAKLSVGTMVEYLLTAFLSVATDYLADLGLDLGGLGDVLSIPDIEEPGTWVQEGDSVCVVTLSDGSSESFLLDEDRLTWDMGDGQILFSRD